MRHVSQLKLLLNFSPILARQYRLRHFIITSFSRTTTPPCVTLSKRPDCYPVTAGFLRRSHLSNAGEVGGSKVRPTSIAPSGWTRATFASSASTRCYTKFFGVFPTLCVSMKTFLILYQTMRSPLCGRPLFFKRWVTFLV